MKKAKRILALFLAVVMVLGLVPVQGREVKAAVVQDSYEQANSVNPGDDYVVVYKRNSNYYALQWDGNSFEPVQGRVINSVFTPNNAVEEDSILWKYNDGFTLASNDEVKVAANDQGTLDSKGANAFKVINNNDTLRTERIGSYNGSYYFLRINDNGWNSRNRDQNYREYSNFTFYKPSRKVTLTVEWYVDDELKTTTTQQVSAGRDTGITRPVEVQGREFVKYVLGETEYTQQIYSVNINQDTTYKFYYKTPSDFPEYPHQGSVKQEKTAEPAEGAFEDNGVAKVELGVTGVPMHKPVEVVVVFDLSGSMDDEINGTAKLASAKIAAKDFVDKMFADNTDGTKSNNKVGLVTFARDHSNSTIRYQLSDYTKKEEMKTTIDNLTANGGTDYDYAFSAADEVLYSDSADPNAEKYVVFMTDGAPSRYNGHLYSEQNYKRNYVIDSNLNVTPHVNSTAVKDKGATVYSIGFGTANGSDSTPIFTGPECTAVLTAIATSDEHFVSAENQDELTKAFSVIASSIKKAGVNARVTDTIGSAYTLQTTTNLPGTPNPDGTEKENKLTTPPTIEVKSYKLDAQHNRTDEVTTKEIVKFDADGTPISVVNGVETRLTKDANGGFEAATFKYIVEFVDGKKVEKFEWTIGDITEEEITLSYYVYLKGAMEGERGYGVYPTNEKATLHYTNYLDNEVERDFPVPTMAWGGALVHYQFYLVNEKGQPVNSLGQVVDFKYRVEVTKPVEIAFPWNSNTTIEAGVVAADVVPEGYELHIANAAYTAHAVSSGAGSSTIIGTIPEGAVESTIEYQKDPQYTNTYVAFGVLNKTTLIPDAVVLDYGKPVSIDVMANDRVQNAVLDSIATLDKKPAAPEGETEFNYAEHNTATLAEGFTSSIDANGESSMKNGNAVIADGEVTYTPAKYMDSIDKFLYSAKVTTKNEDGQNVEFYKYQEVRVIPATTVYYEDNFGNTEDENPTNGIVFNGNWETVTGGNKGEDYQDDGVDSHPYGNDSSYADNNQFSAGSAKVVTATDNTGTTASFKFKGTGFDIIGRTDNDTAVIKVTIKDAGDKIIKSSMLNTVYEEKDGVLYQIPVYQYHDLVYGEYTVEINVKTGKKNEAGEIIKSTNFYLDAIRIYNPLGLDNEEANKQYGKDNEANASVTELRDTLITANTFDSLNSETVAGVVYIDGTEDVISVADYANGGPNNEVYLKPGHSIAFELRTTAEPASVQIGAKSPTGSAKFTIGSNSTQQKAIQLNTATDMYYDIKDAVKFNTNGDGSQNGTVIITNTGEGEAIVSLTNIKVTYANVQTGATQLVVNQEIAEQGIALTQARMQVNDDAAPEEPENPDTPDVEEPENPGSQNPEEIVKEIVDAVKEAADKIKDIFGKWFK